MRKGDRDAGADAAAPARSTWVGPPGPRYYLYVSDAKLDMLAAQIPRGRLDRLAAELSIDLKVISISLKETPSEETRYSKLALVETYLQELGEVGTVDEPGAYFGGSMVLGWGSLVEDRGPLYFSGSTTATVLGLTGSLHHLIGHPQPTVWGEWNAGSILPLGWGHIAGPLDVHEGDELSPKVGQMMEEAALRLIGGSRDSVSFLARRLFREPVGPWAKSSWPHSHVAHAEHLLLGTPIYVCLNS